MYTSELNNVCQRSGWPKPRLNFCSDETGRYTWVYGGAQLGNQLVTSEGRSKNKVKENLHRLLYNLIQDGQLHFPAGLTFWPESLVPRPETMETVGNLGSNPGPPPKLEKVQKPGGRACRQRKYDKLILKIGVERFRECKTCRHRNFEQYLYCLKCKSKLGPSPHQTESAAVTLQAFIRGYQARKLFSELKHETTNIYMT